MLKTLVKKQLMEIFRSYFYNAKTNKKRSTAGIIAYILLFAALMIGLGGMFTGLSASLCAPLTQAGMGWLYFALMSLLAIFLGAFGSVFNTYSGLYFAKDNDLLLSLPIPVRTLMASRLLTVYLMGLMYSAVVILPAVIVYWVTVSTAPMALLGGVLLTALISIFVLTLSCALGWVVAKVSRKLKHKSFITVIVSLAGLAIYYFFVFKAQTAIEQLVANAAVYGEKIKGAAHPLYVFGLTGTGDVTAMLLSAAVILALFALGRHGLDVVGGVGRDGGGVGEGQIDNGVALLLGTADHGGGLGPGQGPAGIEVQPSVAAGGAVDDALGVQGLHRRQGVIPDGGVVREGQRHALILGAVQPQVAIQHHRELLAGDVVVGPEGAVGIAGGDIGVVQEVHIGGRPVVVDVRELAET